MAEYPPSRINKGKPMIQYILRRILTSIPVLIGILLVTFVLARVIPGDPCRAILGEKATDAVCDRFIREKGLDKPILTQFLIYAKEIAAGDFGQSIRLGLPVTRLLAERLPTTVELSFSALILSMLVGIPLGIISAVKHNSWIDVITMVWANIGVSMPVFWLGLMLAYIFSLFAQRYPLLVAALRAHQPGDSKRPCGSSMGISPSRNRIPNGAFRFHWPHECPECPADCQLGIVERCC